MVTQLLGLAVLAVLYGLAWNNRPAKEIKKIKKVDRSERDRDEGSHLNR